MELSLLRHSTIALGVGNTEAGHWLIIQCICLLVSHRKEWVNSLDKNLVWRHWKLNTIQNENFDKCVINFQTTSRLIKIFEELGSKYAVKVRFKSFKEVSNMPAMNTELKQEFDF